MKIAGSQGRICNKRNKIFDIDNLNNNEFNRPPDSSLFANTSLSLIQAISRDYPYKVQCSTNNINCHLNDNDNTCAVSNIDDILHTMHDARSCGHNS